MDRPTKPTAPTTRPALLSSQSQRSFPRSGSESSLFGSLKGLISKPLSWLATPRSAKRDQSTWGAGLDSEDPESPSAKKLRRVSPPRTRGTYDPPARGEVFDKGKGKREGNVASSTCFGWRAEETTYNQGDFDITPFSIYAVSRPA